MTNEQSDEILRFLKEKGFIQKEGGLSQVSFIFHPTGIDIIKSSARLKERLKNGELIMMLF